MKNKKNNVLLSDATFTFDDTAVLMLQTQYHNFELAIALNSTYHLRLARVDNEGLQNIIPPCFSFYDDDTNLAYVLIDKPLQHTPDSPFAPYDKMLLIRGVKAWDFQQMLYNDLQMRQPEPDPDNYMDHQHWQQICQLKESIFPTDTFSFSPVTGTQTSLCPNGIVNMPKATAAYLKRLQKYLQKLFSEVYVSDIRKRHKLKSDSPINEIIDVMSSAVGSLTNPHKLVNTLKSTLGIKTSDLTVANYIGHLKDAFLFSEAKRWDVKGKAYFDYPMKYYCEDIGLLNARLNFREADPSRAMENVIYNELVSRDCAVDVGVVPIVHVGPDGKQALKYHEIDFVVNRAPGKLYIQSAYALPTEEKREQELLPLRRSGDFFRKMIIVNGNAAPRVSEDGIISVGIIPFLLVRRC